MKLFHTHISEASKKYVQEVMDSGWLSEGPMVQRFEEGLSHLGLANPVAVNSGTSALYLALIVSGIKAEDEVILPAQTFVATASAIKMCGAVPVFADIDPMTGNICPESVKKKISEATKAIIPVHWSGLPCQLTDLAFLTWGKGISLIEDAAHALGATYRGIPIGYPFGMACFSFQATKHLTTGGDGGALCTQNIHLSEQARLKRWFGIDRKQPVSLLGDRNYFLEEWGTKLHMNDFSAAMGVGNLEDFLDRLTRRQAIGKQYREAFEGLKDVTLLHCPKYLTHSYYVFSMRVKRRDNFVRKMRARQVPCSVINRRIDLHPCYGALERGGSLPGQNEFDLEHIALPCHEALTEEDVSWVIESVQGGW